MKQLTIVLCALFIFTACEKTTEDLPGNANSGSPEKDAAVSAGKRAFTFDVTKQGWQIEGDAILAYSPKDGNPPGCIYGIDKGSDDYWYFRAPQNLLTAIRSKSGSYSLKFDLKAPSSNNTNEPDVAVVSKGITLVIDLPDDPNDVAWTTYTVPVIPGEKGGWRVGDLSGPFATGGQIKKAFNNIQDLLIRGEFYIGDDNVGFLDNVTYE